MLTGAILAGTSVLLAAPEPSEAQAPTATYTPVVGDFLSGDGRDEVLYYAPGPGYDTLMGFGMGIGRPFAWPFAQFTANGTYTPLVGDFDGDRADEILWYAPGPAPDSMWHFRPADTFSATVVSVPFQINGDYGRPTAGDFTGDGTDDVLWYAPGTAPDVMWDFDQGGSYTSSGRTISGTYQPVTASFGNDVTDDILWYAPGAQLDPMWDHVPGSTGYTQQVYDVRGTYSPFTVDLYADGPGGEDIFWYAPGAGGDSVWDFHGGQRRSFPDPRTATTSRPPATSSSTAPRRSSGTTTPSRSSGTTTRGAPAPSAPAGSGRRPARACRTRPRRRPVRPFPWERSRPADATRRGRPRGAALDSGTGLGPGDQPAGGAIGCGVQSSSYSAITIWLGSIEQAGHSGSRSIL